MTTPDFTITEHSCGPTCWEAREDICHCSCGGKNHGCLRDNNGVRPVRQSRIDGYRYELAEIGASEVAAAHLIRDLRGNDNWWYGSIREPGAEYRVKAASENQMQWPELAAWRGNSKPNLLWKRVE